MTGVRGQGARADFFGNGVAVGESCLETVELGAHEGLRYGPERRLGVAHKKKGRAPCGASRCFWSGYLRLQNEQVGQGQPRLNAIL